MLQKWTEQNESVFPLLVITGSHRKSRDFVKAFSPKTYIK